MPAFLKVTQCIAILACLYLGCIGLFQFDILKYLFKMQSAPIHLLYTCIGLCGICNILWFKKK